LGASLCRRKASAASGRLLTPPALELEASTQNLDVENDASVRRLAAAVLDFPHAFEIPAAIRAICLPRLTQAEKAYCRGQSVGVHESSIVFLVNDAADTLNAPAFAQVSAHQVRVLRVATIQHNPVFMGRGVLVPGAAVGESIPSYMSPSQAVHLTLFIADQKFMNDWYQYEPAEWEARYPELQAARARSATPISGSPCRAVVRSNPKGADLSVRVTRSLESMSLSSIAAFADKCLVSLGL